MSINDGGLSAPGHRAVLERIAREIHQRYVESARARGETVNENAALVGWDDLPTSLRVSNVDQAAHIERKLRLIGCEVVEMGTIGDDERVRELADADVERLARAEHERWVADRKRSGWVPSAGPGKDVANQATPHLVGWDDLDEDVRELDREAVRSMPAVLAAAGLAIRPCR